MQESIQKKITKISYESFIILVFYPGKSSVRRTVSFWCVFSSCSVTSLQYSLAICYGKKWRTMQSYFQYVELIERLFFFAWSVLKYIIKSTTEIKRKNYYLLICYIQNKGKRNKRNVRYVQVKYKEVFELVTGGLLVHFFGSMGHNTEFCAGYITSSCIWLAVSVVENINALMHPTYLLLLHEWNDRKPEHDMNYIYAINTTSCAYNKL